MPSAGAGATGARKVDLIFEIAESEIGEVYLRERIEKLVGRVDDDHLSVF